MRLSATLLALLAAASLAACTGNSGNSGSSSSDASAAPAASAAASAASGGSAMATTDIPDYPGATKMASAGTAASAGTVETTSDPVAKVTDFYKSKLGADAKMTTMSAPTEATVFTIGDVTSGTYSSVTIAAMGGKTGITIAKVKKQ